MGLALVSAKTAMLLNLVQYQKILIGDELDVSRIFNVVNLEALGTALDKQCRWMCVPGACPKCPGASPCLRQAVQRLWHQRLSMPG